MPEARAALLLFVFAWACAWAGPPAAAAVQSPPGGGEPAAPGGEATGADPEADPDADAAPSAEAVKAADAAALAIIEKVNHAIEERVPADIRPALTQLDEIYAQIPPKTLKKVLKSVSAMFAKLVPRTDDRDIDTLGDDAFNPFGPDEDEEQPVAEDPKAEIEDCYHVAIGVLYDKPEGAAVLLPVLKLPHIKSWPEMQALVLEGLGYRGDPALAKDLEAYLRHPNALVASAAAGGLGKLREEPMDVRRQVVGALVDAFSAARKAADKEAAKAGEDEEELPAKRYLSSIHVAFREALTSLTRQTHDKPAEWREWFDAHGKDASW
jgi:hypothetical protein